MRPRMNRWIKPGIIVLIGATLVLFFRTRSSSLSLFSARSESLGRPSTVTSKPSAEEELGGQGKIVVPSSDEETKKASKFASFLEYEKTAVPTKFKEFFEQQGLDEAQQAKFTDLATTIDLIIYEATNGGKAGLIQVNAPGETLTVNYYGVPELYSSILPQVAPVEEAIHQLLGDPGYENYNSYAESLPTISRYMGHLENALKDNNEPPLTPTQEDQLVKLLTADSAGSRWQAVLIDMSDASLAAAMAFLSPVQYNELVKYRQHELNVRQLENNAIDEKRASLGLSPIVRK
jgi:hypothetical protein